MDPEVIGVLNDIKIAVQWVAFFAFLNLFNTCKCGRKDESKGKDREPGNQVEASSQGRSIGGTSTEGR